MGANVGNINLGLNVDYAGFNSQLTGIKKQAEGSLTSAFKGLGKVAAAAFSISAITKFTKSCLDLGSALSEVQNVVDVTFGPQGAKVIESFSKSAMSAFGLSELKAKQYTSTLGAMYKSMGLSTDQALGMSVEMTKLAGDMASFYNLDPDEAFNKIRSGISGETEPLKQLGINMSVANLEAFALSKGITASYNSMNQASQAMLRYQYLLSVTSDAQGDFARTSDSWANQTRILKLQFDSLKSTLGQAFITVLTPVIRVINTLMAKLVQLASIFNSFISRLFGKKSGGSALGSAASDASAVESSLSGASGAADNVSSGLGGGAKAAKKIKTALAGFDELQILDTKQDEDVGGGGGGATPDLGMEAFDFEGDTTVLEEATEDINDMHSALDRFLNITGLDTFFAKIKTGFESVNWEGIKNNFKSIGESSIPILEAAAEGALKVLRSMLSALGSLTSGVVGVVGDSIEIVSGGIAKFLANQGPVISEWISEISSKFASGFDNIASIYDTVFQSFRNALASTKSGIEDTISNILTAITNFQMQVGTIWADIWQIATGEVLNFVTANQPLIEQFFTSIFELLSQVGNFVATVIQGLATTLSDFWNNYGKTIWNGIVSAITDIMGWVMKIWTTVLQPVFSYLFSNLSSLWSAHLQPLVSKVASFVGEVGNFILALWNGILKPVINWIINTIGPIVVSVANTVISVVKNLIGTISDILGGIIDFLKGIIQFITGVFTGDWSKAWEGIKNIFGGFCDVIKSLFSGLVNILKSLLSGLANIFKSIWNGIKSTVVSIANAIATTLSNIWTSIKNVVSTIFNAIKNLFSTIWNSIKSTVTTIVNGIATTLSNVWTSIKNTVSTVFNAVKSTFSTIWNSIKSTVTTIVNGISTTISNVFNSVKNSVSTIWNSIKTTISNVINGISTTISNVFNSIKNTLSTVLNSIKSTFTSVWNAISTAVKTPINAIIGGINKLITGLNRIKIDIPSWVPVLGGKQFGFNIPQIPKLAQGGIVSAPMIAQVGDNPRSSEVVSPLHELIPMITNAVSAAVAAAFAAAPAREEGDINIPIYLNDSLLDDVIVTAEQRRKLRTGGA